jgi:hypothetical protein
MKFWKSIPFILTAILLGIFLLASTSCSQQKYSTGCRVKYNKTSRIKVYKKPSNRNSFGHSSPVKKKYVVKK